VLAGAAAVLAGLALVGASSTTVRPPPAAGPWKQVGAVVTSKPGKQLHFYRQMKDPQALAFVVVSSSLKRITVRWSSYCELESDDVMTDEHQGTLTGVHLVVGYPPALDGATLCSVWVNAGASGTAALAAAQFAY
jgi:hypothetical protein